jgi:Ca2+-binding EF-hand superfamily protein
MRVKILLILGLVLLLMDGGSVLAQQGDDGGSGRGGRGGRGFPGGGGPGGGFPGGGRKGGRGGMGFDPAQIFDQFAGGKNVISRDDIDPNNRMAVGMFDRITQTLNITNNQITREQFVTGFEQMRQNFGGRGGPGGRGGDQGPGGRGANVDDMAEAQFKQLDKNNDGFLNTDEMPAGLRSQLARYDSNHDNLIDLQEFKAYLRDQSRQGGMNMNQPAMYELANIPEPEEEKRPVVYNAKNYPKELPAWFKQLDVDNDGQIALYEWRRSGRSIEEFMAMDRNEDGFLTIEEVLYAVARRSTKSGDVQTASFSPGEGPAMSNGSPGDGLPNAGSQGFGPGKGFFNKGQFGNGGNGQFRGPGGQGGPGAGDQAQMGRRGRGGFGPPGVGDNGNGDSRGKKGGGRRGGNGQNGNGYGG